MSSQNASIAAFGRLLAAAIFLVSGLGKIADPVVTQGYIATTGLPAPILGYGLAVAVEAIGGVLLVIGYRTRLVALGLALFSVATAIFFHANFADQNQMIHFLKNIAIAGGLLQIVAFGGGAWSVDARLGARRTAVAA